MKDWSGSKYLDVTFDERYVATVNEKGEMRIAVLPGVDTMPYDGIGFVRIPPKAARKIVAELEEVAEEAEGYTPTGVEAVQHWILAQAYRSAA